MWRGRSDLHCPHRCARNNSDRRDPHEARISLGAAQVPVPEPLAAMLNRRLRRRPKLCTGGGMIAVPWLVSDLRRRHLDAQSHHDEVAQTGNYRESGV